MNAKIILAILVLSLASMACGFTVNFPNRPQAGPEVKESITVQDPKSEQTRLSISLGAGKLKLSPGAGNLVDGAVIYNVESLKPEVIEAGSNIEIKQGNLTSLPPFKDIKNEWDLKLGDMPMDLVISAGAYEGRIELGGLALRSLTVKDGASNVDLSFSRSNTIDMSILQYTTGASDVKLTGLANANFSTLTFSGGAGNFTLDFSGDLKKDGVVTIDSGLGNVSLIIPQNINARVTVDSAAVNINHGSGWNQNGKDYTQQGEGPTLTFVVKMAAGNLLMSND
ncbi:MAG: toast rack family protein [Syntrophothermus sp.]